MISTLTTNQVVGLKSPFFIFNNMKILLISIIVGVFATGAFSILFLMPNDTVEPKKTILNYKDYDGELFMENRCKENFICWGVDTNGTKIDLDCSNMILHGCPPTVVGNYTEVP